ncbi:DUF732 domain-containing protein [Streptomyces sp. NPDC001774]
MRRTTTATLAAALLLTLTACGSDEPPADKPAASSATPTTSPSAAYLASVKAANFESWATEAPSDDELTALPPRWCTELTAGHSVAYILDDASLYPAGQTWGTAKPDAQELIVLGVTAYCPEHRAQVTEELRASGF